MRIIKLKKLALTNFKGIRSLTIRFDEETNIYGDNATGKTSIFDAFLWLLFGKDSTDRKDFEIKTLGPDNQPYHRLDHEVEAVLEIDGNETIIKRSLREKWTKKRGSSETEFTGHETTFFWNDVPLKENEYQAKVNSFVDEKVFKLLTNLSYFNTAIKWQDRRSVLLSIAGTITNEDVFDKVITVQNKGSFAGLINALNARKSVSEYRSEISAKKKKINEELKLIPARIDEANRSLPEELDYKSIESKITEAQQSLQEIEDALNDVVKAQRQDQQALQTKMNDIQELKRSISNIEFAAKNSVKDKKQARDQAILDLSRRIGSLNSDIRNLNNDITGDQNRKLPLETQQATLREDWTKVNVEHFDEEKINKDDFCCPTCKRSFDAEVIEEKIVELKSNFNQDKSLRLSSITNRGQKLGEEIAALNTKLSNLLADLECKKNELADHSERLNELQKENERLSSNEEQETWQLLESNIEYTNACAKVKELEEEVNAPKKASSDNSDLILRKKGMQEVISIYQKQLSSKEQREKILARIAELETSESQMANELASLEGIEFTITQFEKAQMDLLESRINDRFQVVKFKLFDTQINGGEVPCCITLINGVPYPDANTASKAQAGLDIINVLSDHFKVVAPVFFDNRESVVKLPATKAQIINLRVVEGAKLSVDKIEWKADYRKAEMEVA